jgi:hypothetical protein
MSSRIRPAFESLLHGLISLGIAVLLAGFILLAASQHGRHGNTQLAADSLRMLWSPAIFAAVGALLIANGSLRGLWLLLRRPSRLPTRSVSSRTPQIRPSQIRSVPSQPAPPADVAPARPADAYRLACAELGVEPGSDWAVVRSAWRRNLPRWHPDQGGDRDTWSRKLAAYTLLEAWEQFQDP